MRVLGVDLGTRRIGVATSDTAGRVATPHRVIVRNEDPADDYAELAHLVRDLGAEKLVVGLPLSLDGSVGPAARAALREVDALADVAGVPVETHDERLTTVTAQRPVRSASAARTGPSGARAGRRRRDLVDSSAAAVMLQSWLDRRRS